jgi:hypothetical protein
MCINCDEIIQVGNSGTNGWSPILALYEGECDGDAVTVHQLISWDGGSGTRPSYSGNIMTNQWLIDHPIYLGSDGFVTDICEATNLQPADGATGATGPQGPAGPTGEAGNDGCDPVISILASVVGGDKTYEVDVIGPGESPCFPIYELEFPIEMITDNSELTTAIDEAVLAALQVSPQYNEITSISNNLGTGQVRYTSSSSFNLSTLIGTLYTSHIIIGNRMTLSFRFSILTDVSGISTITKLELKIPDSKTSKNANDNNAIGYHKYTLSGTVMTPVITTNNADDSYLNITFPISTGFSGLTANFGEPVTFQGQITFTIN